LDGTGQNQSPEDRCLSWAAIATPLEENGGGDTVTTATHTSKNAEKAALKSTGARTAADQAFSLHPLASELANAANGFCLFAGALLRRLLVVVAHLHFAENAFALHLLLESAERLVNVVVADKYLHVKSRSFSFVLSQQEE
jgi:hypothetical protein